jgi:hypothetical protein
MLFFKKTINIFFIVIFLFFGCKQETDMYNVKDAGKIIKINPKKAKEEIKLSKFVDSIKYIKLQTDSSCVLGRKPLFFSIKEKYIYVSDGSQHTIFLFNKKGKYITKLNKYGNGPKEYHTAWRFRVDKNEEYIEIIDLKKQEIFKYSNISFNLFEKRKIPEINANTYIKKDSIYYFSTHQLNNKINNNPTNASIIIVKNGEIIGTLFDKNISNQINFFFYPFGKSFIKNEKNEIFVSIKWDNTFYKLHNMNAHPVYTVDFGKYNYNNAIGKESMKKQKTYVKNTTNLASFPVLNINNTNIMGFSYYFKQKVKSDIDTRYDVYGNLHQYIKFKNSNKSFHTKKFINDITNFPTKVDLSTYYGGLIHQLWNNGYLIDIIFPNEHINKGKTQKQVKDLGKIEIDDNPIIVLMKLKKEYI